MDSLPVITVCRGGWGLADSVPNVWDDLTDLHRDKGVEKTHPEQAASLGRWSTAVCSYKEDGA